MRLKTPITKKTRPPWRRSGGSWTSCGAQSTKSAASDPGHADDHYPDNHYPIGTNYPTGTNVTTAKSTDTAKTSGSAFSGYQKVVVAVLAFLQFTIVLDFMLLAPLGALVIPALKITPSQFGWL